MSAAGGFCSFDAVLNEAGLSVYTHSGAASPDAPTTTELTAGFCNVVNMVRVDGERDTVVVKTFGDLARARILAGDSLCFPVERAATKANIAPALLHASNNGSVNVFLGPQWTTLSEAVVSSSIRSTMSGAVDDLTWGRHATQRDAAHVRSPLICAVAAALAQLHAIELDDVEPERALSTASAPAPAAGARYARCKPRIWTSVDVLLEIAQHKSERLPAGWDIGAVAAACARERARLDGQNLPMVTGHGDFKPSNVMVVLDEGGDIAPGAVNAQIIDFELAGPNYRGFDLCKFFRRDSGPLPVDALGLFASEYLAAGATLVSAVASKGAPPKGGSADDAAESAAAAAVAALAAEATELEPLTWLEAAVFFLAFMCSGEVILNRERYLWAAALATQRWGRFVELRPAETAHDAAFTPRG